MQLDVPIIGCPPVLTQVTKPVLGAIGVPRLAEYIHYTLISFVASCLVQYLSSVISPRLFPTYYPTIKKKRQDWDLHVVGWLFSIVAAPLAISHIRHPSLAVIKDPVYGFAEREARLSAVACGYFLWDTLVSAQNLSTQGFGFLMHGFGCFAAFTYTLAPFLLQDGPNFLVWETSTIFLNAHWFLDKFRMTGSTAQLINGVFLISTYVGSRVIWGSYRSFICLRMLFGSKRDPRVGAIRWLYGPTNVALNSLNLFWLRAMIMALKKRFVNADPQARRVPIQVDGKLNAYRKEDTKAE